MSITQMKLTLERRYRCNGYTIGHLSIDGRYFCDTLEDADRGLTADMPLDMIMKKKLKSITAIPTGTYLLTLDVESPRFKRNKFYKEVCQGRLPRLVYVNGFDGILIHCGNTAKDTDGCILVGENKVKGQVIRSKETFRRLYPILKDANDKGKRIILEVK